MIHDCAQPGCLRLAKVGHRLCSRHLRHRPCKVRGCERQAVIGALLCDHCHRDAQRTAAQKAEARALEDAALHRAANLGGYGDAAHRLAIRMLAGKW